PPSTAAPPRAERRAPSTRERELALLGVQRIGELVELALKDVVELVHGQLDPVIRDAVLGEVVRADLFGAFPSADLRTARRVELLALPFELALVEARAEYAHRLVLVLKLRLLVLHRDDNAGRQVRDANRGVRRVDGLPAGA